MENVTHSPKSLWVEQQKKLINSPFGSRYYKTHSGTNRNTTSQQLYQFSGLKSNSLTNTLNKKEETITESKIIDCCTQTSKTILQLAELDESGPITPDSLMQSPKKSETLDDINNLFSLKLQSTLEQYSTDMNSPLNYTSGQGYGTNGVTEYTRSNYLQQYLGNNNTTKKSSCNGYPNSSLTNTFLAKKHNEDLQPSCHCRSRFLQQTSPLRNLSSSAGQKCNFKSKSYLERHSSELSPTSYRDKTPISRFTVKNVQDRPCVDNPDPHSLLAYLTVEGNIEDNLSNHELEENISYSPSNLSPKKRIHSKRRKRSFMSPTIASEQRNQQHLVQTVTQLMSPTRRGRSVSPHKSPRINVVAELHKESIPYIDQNCSQLSLHKSQIYTTKSTKREHSNNAKSSRLLIESGAKPTLQEDLSIDLKCLNLNSTEVIVDGNTQCSVSSTSSTENIISQTMHRIQNSEWSIALKGLADITELCRTMDNDLLFPYMTSINQRLLQLLRSPRSHVSRTACQIAGSLFESMKDTRRPEFDDIVEVLLSKTADANKFIRKDANLSLDCMITHVPIYHAVRSVCLKGPSHKNPLVRSATTRLIVCAVVIVGPDMVLNLPGHEHSRKRIIQLFPQFLSDKNLETRQYGERLYKILSKDEDFETILKKYLDLNEITKIKMLLKRKNQNR